MWSTISSSVHVELQCDSVCVTCWCWAYGPKGWTRCVLPPNITWWRTPSTAPTATFTVTNDWSESTVQACLDADQWTCLGSRHDRTATYGHRPLETVLADVNTNILLVLFPLDISPMGPLDGDPHTLRPEEDYPVWRRRLPEGYVTLDDVRIEFP